jgi:hypothetical protein
VVEGADGEGNERGSRRGCAWSWKEVEGESRLGMEADRGGG